MKKTLSLLSAIACFTSLILCVSAPIEASSPKVFLLSDGTTLRGTITGIRRSDDAYLIETTSIGTVAVHPDDILQMTSADHSGAMTQEPAAPFLSKSFENAQQLLLSDPSIQSALQELANDPEALHLLQDPAVLQAVMSMDPRVVQSDPNIQKLLQHPAMQKILRLSQEKLLETPHP